MGTRVSLIERIIDRMTTEEAATVCMEAGSPDFSTARNVYVMKGWMLQNLHTRELKDAVVKLIKDRIG